MAARSTSTWLQLLLHLLVLRPLVRLVFGAGIEGREHLRGLSQFILVANHNSHLDLPLLFQLLPLRQIPRTHPMAAHEYFSRSRLLFRSVELLFGPVWVVRGVGAAPAAAPGAATAGAPDREAGPSPEAAMAAMREHLRAGRNVVIFPEGTRGRPGELAPFRKGVGRLAVEFPQVPVVPVYLAGTERALPKAAGLPIPLWTRIVVGPPLRYVEEGAQTGARSAAAAAAAAGRVTAELERQVRSLAERETARRHRRQERRPPGPMVAVLGIDGSGKSTLARTLAERLSADRRVALVSDEVLFLEKGAPLRLQPLLSEQVRRRLNRRVKTAKSLKSYKIPKLAELLLRDHVAGQLLRWRAADVIVLDGCPVLNLAAWAKLYRDAEYDDDTCAALLRAITGRDTAAGRRDTIFRRFPELSALARLHLIPLRAPDAVLFLDVAPAVSMERILARGETQQVHETEDKLARLREGYLTVCRVLESALGLPARILDGDRSREEIAAEALGQLGTLLGPRELAPGVSRPSCPLQDRRSSDA
jgi:1-acyl-sn-glycerol-3-phosphate acyltransferase/thymidylate kinase